MWCCMYITLGVKRISSHAVVLGAWGFVILESFRLKKTMSVTNNTVRFIVTQFVYIDDKTKVKVETGSCMFLCPFQTLQSMFCRW